MTTSPMCSSFSASSWTQLTSTLNSVEKEIRFIHTRADERVRKEAERIKMVQRKREEIIEEHRRLMEEHTDEYNRRIDAISAMTNREIADHKHDKECAEARVVEADKCVAAAEHRSRELEKQVRQLYVIYDQACADHDRRVEDVRREADVRVKSKLEESSRLVRDTGLYATQVQAEGMLYMAELEDDTRLKRKDLERKSFQRSRYKDLFDVVRTHAHCQTPHREFLRAKTDILQDWHEDWQMHASGLIRPPDAVSPGFRDVSSSLSNYECIDAEDILDTVVERFSSPVPPDTPRSKDTALSRAAQFKRDMVKREGLERPMTAPPI